MMSVREKNKRPERNINDELLFAIKENCHDKSRNQTGNDSHLRTVQFQLLPALLVKHFQSNEMGTIMAIFALNDMQGCEL